MNAFGFFKRLLGQSPNVATDPLAELGLDPSSTDEFLRRLVRSQVWIMSQGKAMETESPTPEEALEHIRRGAQRLAAVDSADQIQIYIHEIDNEPILPFFSSADLMQAIVPTLLIDRITNFEGVSVPF